VVQAAVAVLVLSEVMEIQAAMAVTVVLVSVHQLQDQQFLGLEVAVLVVMLLAVQHHLAAVLVALQALLELTELLILAAVAVQPTEMLILVTVVLVLLLFVTKILCLI
jgi:hypothetical protein